MSMNEKTPNNRKPKLPRELIPLSLTDVEKHERDLQLLLRDVIDFYLSVTLDTPPHKNTKTKISDINKFISDTYKLKNKIQNTLKKLHPHIRNLKIHI